MIRHVMADGSRRDNIDGYILPKDISETLLSIILKKERENASDKTRVIREK